MAEIHKETHAVQSIPATVPSKDVTGKDVKDSAGAEKDAKDAKEKEPTKVETALKNLDKEFVAPEFTAKEIEREVEIDAQLKRRAVILNDIRNLLEKLSACGDVLTALRAELKARASGVGKEAGANVAPVKDTSKDAAGAEKDKEKHEVHAVHT